jgi:hypothetical protein
MVILSLVAVLSMLMGILLRLRLPRSHQTGRVMLPMHILHHRMPVVSHRILCPSATDATPMPLWVVLASVAGALMIVAPNCPVAIRVRGTV